MGNKTVISLREAVGGGYDEFWNCRKRYRVVKGGKASKKSTTMALWLITMMMRPEFHLANALVVRNVMATHRESTFSQLQWAIHKLKAERWWKAKVSPMELVYVPTGQKILFRGFDDPLKLASVTVPRGKLCWVWIEEAYELQSEADFDKLDLSAPRGEMPPPLFPQTTLTLNPWNEGHWIKKRFFDRTDERVLAMTTNYLCNEHLSADDRTIYERMKADNPRQYDVAGLGNWGVAEGLVYENWTVEGFNIQDVVKEKPWQWRHIFGMDYGFTNDPTAFIAAAVNPLRREIYVYDEHSERGMLNSDIAAMIIRKGYQKERIRADCAEAKSNEELRRMGLHRIHASEKGRDSIIAGIMRLQEYRIIIHPMCRSTATEIAAYCWEKDRLGHTLNKAEDRNNHLMDALRYAMEDITNFHPSEEAPKLPRVNRSGVTARDMSGGWS